MSTAPDICFPRHDGSGADPVPALSHALVARRLVQSVESESVQLHAGRKSSAGGARTPPHGSER